MDCIQSQDCLVFFFLKTLFVFMWPVYLIKNTSIKVKFLMSFSEWHIASICFWAGQDYMHASRALLRHTVSNSSWFEWAPPPPPLHARCFRKGWSRASTCLLFNTEDHSQPHTHSLIYRNYTLLHIIRILTMLQGSLCWNFTVRHGCHGNCACHTEKPH